MSKAKSRDRDFPPTESGKPHISQGRQAVGLDAAYYHKDGVYVDRGQRTIYVAGTRPNLNDIVTDITEVPTSGTSNSARYGLVQNYVAQLVAKDASAGIPPRPIKLVGHSLGSAVVGQYMADHPKNKQLEAFVYDWPTVSIYQKDKRIVDQTHYFDPVSALDFSAHHSIGIPHSYH